LRLDTVLVAANESARVKASPSSRACSTARNELDSLPPVFFNMDADTVLGERALERMVAKLVTPGRLTKQRPTIVASNCSCGANTSGPAEELLQGSTRATGLARVPDLDQHLA